MSSENKSLFDIFLKKVYNQHMETNIRKIRKEKNITQKQLAEKFNLHQTAISEWESGRTYPRIEIAIQLANYFGVTIDYLLGREPDSGLVYVHKDPALTDDEKELLNIYRNITPELKENARSMIDLMPKVSQDKQIKKGG